MPVCITGMHRSGTSLVARLLQLCGLYLGPEKDLLPASPDNLEGYWENTKFVDLNDDVLRELGGAWDLPPVPPAGWFLEPRFTPLRVRAELLLEEFSDREPWGWKDPRNCLTLPFWKSLDGFQIPFFYGFGASLKVVLCLRNPVEVFGSLRDRKRTPNTAGLELWLIYNRELLAATLANERIVTHYESYFENPRAELRRLFNFLEMKVADEVVERAVHAVSEKLRHQQFHAQELPAQAIDGEVGALYEELSREALNARRSAV